MPKGFTSTNHRYPMTNDVTGNTTNYQYDALNRLTEVEWQWRELALWLRQQRQDDVFGLCRRYTHRQDLQQRRSADEQRGAGQPHVRVGFQCRSANGLWLELYGRQLAG